MCRGPRQCLLLQTPSRAPYFFLFQAGLVFTLVSSSAPRGHSSPCVLWVCLSLWSQLRHSPGPTPEKGRGGTTVVWRPDLRYSMCLLLSAGPPPTSKGPTDASESGLTEEGGRFSTSPRPHCRPHQLAFPAVMSFPNFKVHVGISFVLKRLFNLLLSFLLALWSSFLICWYPAFVCD